MIARDRISRHEEESMQVEITFEAFADEREKQAVIGVAETLGLQCKGQYELHIRADVQVPAWLIILALPTYPVFHSFLQGFGSEAGKWAWHKVRDTVAQFAAARKQSPGCLELADEETHTHLILSHNLPDEAYQQLVEILEEDPEQLQGGYWTWEENEQRWSRK